MDNALFKLSIVLGKISKRKERIEGEMEELRLDPKVARYLELNGELNKANTDYNEAEKERIFVTCSHCRHLKVQTGFERDPREGRLYVKLGCIKCGIDQNLYEYDNTFGNQGLPETFEDQAILEYMQKYKPAFYYKDVDLDFFSHEEFLRGREIFSKLSARNRDLTDKDVAELMKKHKDYVKSHERARN